MTSRTCDAETMDSTDIANMRCGNDGFHRHSSRANTGVRPYTKGCVDFNADVHDVSSRQAGTRKDITVPNRFLDLLARGGPIVADGGMGTMLMAAGLLFGDPPEQWNILPQKRPQISAIH